MPHVLRVSWEMVRQVHPPSEGMRKGLMAGVLLLLALVVLTPLGSGGLRSRPVHFRDAHPQRGSHRWGSGIPERDRADPM